MKWKDLSLKERKQIYDSVRVNNPGATYFDIKQQFDSIPAYQDGKGKTINKADLPPEYRTGTPEYFERQRKISGAVNAVQPEAYITPAGYIMENLYPVYPIPSYKDGGIHIKKKNRGKFNALKKRTGKSTEELTHSKNPLTRKRAIFAQNAAKWNHKGRKKK